MATIGKVRAVFTASTSGLVAGVNQAAGSMRKLASSVSGLRSGMNALVAIQGAQLFGSIASAAGQYIRQLVAMGQAQADVIDRQSKLAARLGFTYGEFAALALAGDLAGVSMDTIAAASTRADVAFVKAVNGSAQAQAAFSGLGLSLDDLNRMSAAERFQAIAEAIARLPTEAQRSAAAVQLFGRAGAELLPLFSGGAEGIAEAAAQAERLGLTLTNAQGQDVEAMNDAFTLAGKAIEGIVTQVVAYLSPAVKAIADTFTTLVGDIGGANIGKAIGDGILAGARFLAGIGDYLIANFGNVFSYLSKVGEQWNAVVDFMSRIASLFSAVFNLAQAALGGLILYFSSQVEGLATIAQKIGQYLRFDTSSLDAFVAGSQAFNNELRSGIQQNLSQAGSDFAAAFATNGGNAAGQAIAGPLTTAVDESIARANASRSKVDQASRDGAAKIGEAVAAAAQPQQVKGIDSRSAEGVAEMFRIMRGDAGNVQERIASATERAADALESQEPEYPFAIEGA